MKIIRGFDKRIVSVFLILVTLFYLVSITGSADSMDVNYITGEANGSIFSLPSTAVKGQLGVTLGGNTSTNIIPDGDFSGGTANWRSFANWGTATLSMNGTKLKATGTGAGNTIGVCPTDLLMPVAANKVYIKARVKNSSAFSVSFYIYAGGTTSSATTTSTQTIGIVNAGETKDVSIVFTISASGLSGNFLPVFSFTAASTSGMIMEIEPTVMTINLTGEGLSSLTAADCVLRFPNFFDGTKSTFKDGGRLSSVGKNRESITSLICNASTWAQTYGTKIPVVPNTVIYLKQNITGTHRPVFRAYDSGGNLITSGITVTDYNGQSFTYSAPLTCWITSANTGSSANTLITITANANIACIKIGLSTGDQAVAATSNNILVSQVATTYEAYTSTEAYIPPSTNGLTSLSNGTKDEIDVASGVKTQRNSGLFNLDGSYTWSIQADYTGYKTIQAINVLNGNYTAANSTLRKYNGISLPDRVTWDKGDIKLVGSNNATVYITVNNTDSGWTEAMNPSDNECKAYFYGWKMCASDGGAYVSGDKYWKNILTGGDITAANAVPTTLATGYTPYTLTYQLATPQTSYITPQPLICHEGGSVIVEPAVKETAAYNAGIFIMNTGAPISSIESVCKINGNITIPVNPSNITVSQDKLSFTIAGANNGDLYQYVYLYDSSLTTLPDIEYTVPINATGQINDNTDMIKAQNEMINNLTARLEKLEAQTSTTTLAGPFQIDCTANENFSIVLTAANSKDFSSRTFTVIYDPDELDVADLCAQTPELETAPCNVEGTNIVITQVSPGYIGFFINNPIEQSTSYSGSVNTIEFMPKITGQATVSYMVQ